MVVSLTDVTRVRLHETKRHRTLTSDDCTQVNGVIKKARRLTFSRTALLERASTKKEGNDTRLVDL